MPNVSDDELVTLGSTYTVDVGDENLDDLRRRVESVLDAVTDFDDFAVSTDEGDFAVVTDEGDFAVATGECDFEDRTWNRADDAPHGAISTYCDVPPPDDNTGLLDGLSVGVKDCISVAGVPMNCGSAVLEGFACRTDAPVVERLRRAGATITAKTNLDEFAGSSWGVSVDGRITNPHDDRRVAGGSSGGSAAAVATDQVDVALGTDTGGSIRIPAALCGVVGLKPTYGLVPASGVVENTYSLDHVGPITATVDEAAAVLEAIAGVDDRDARTARAAARDDYAVGGYTDALADDVDPSLFTVGRLASGFGPDVSRAVRERTEAALGRASDAGATVTDVALPRADAVHAVKQAIALPELAAHWRSSGAPVRRNGAVDATYQATFEDRIEHRSGELETHYKSKLLAGGYLLERQGYRQYNRARHARRVLEADVADALESVDVLVTPTVPDVAPRLDDAEQPGFRYGENTRLASVTRHPAVTVPNGTVDGLPVGVQLLGRRFGDAELLRAARVFEEGQR